LQQDINVFTEIIRIDDYRNVRFNLTFQPDNKLFQCTKIFTLFVSHRITES